MEEHVVSEMGIAVQLRVAAVGSPPSLRVPTENMHEPMLDLLRYLREIHVVAATRWALDLSRTNFQQSWFAHTLEGRT